MVDSSTLLITIFVLVDHWYQQKGYGYVPLLPVLLEVMTSHTLRIFLRQRFGIDVLTFEQHPILSLT